LKGSPGKSPLAARTVGHVHRAIHKALVVAVEWKLLSRNPAALVRPPRVEETEITIPTTEDVQRILRLLKGRALYPIVVLAVATGMRRGELLALRWGDIDHKAGLLRVERAVEETKKHGLRIKPPKTKKGRRVISLPPAVLAELTDHWTHQQEHRLKLGLGRATDDDLMFPTWDGRLRNPRQVTCAWECSVVALKLPNIGLHTFRHFSCIATHCRRLGPGGDFPPTRSRINRGDTWHLWSLVSEQSGPRGRYY
jgi:integrase